MLLANMHPSVFALDPDAGLADETVSGRVAVGIAGAAIAAVVISIGIAAQWRCRNGACGSDRAACQACRTVGGDEARMTALPAVLVPTVMPAIVPASTAVRAGAIGSAAPIIIRVRISRSQVLAIGVRIILRAIARVLDHLLRHGGASQGR